MVALGFEAADPTGYGRLIERGGRLIAIREHKDASAEERASRLCNAGPIAFSGAEALKLLEAVTPNNAQREYYLTDIVEIADTRGLVARALIADEKEVMGVNDRAQLAASRGGAAGSAAPSRDGRGRDAYRPRDGVPRVRRQNRPRRPHRAPCRDRPWGQDRGRRDHPRLLASRGRAGGEGRVRRPVRPAETGGGHRRQRRIGNFVEIKQAMIEEGAKVNHLTYIGDARVGANANIGAGTITCNYDGFAKHKTDIGAGAFIGSNSALVAPVTIGDGAYIGSGSVITQSVEADALAVARGRQETKAGWAKAFRDRHKKG